MSSITVVLGILLLVLVMTDVLVTTLTVGGGGPLTSRLSRWIWRIALRIHQWRSNHRFLSVAGWIILVSTVLLWFAFIFVGWTLIFSTTGLEVVNASTKQPATTWETIYFVGYTLTTLGIGDYQPQGTVWQLATSVASANGFVMVSLAIAYLLPVVSAATQKRQLAVYISSLGGTPDEIITRAWNGKNFGQFDQHLISLSPQVALQGEQHLTYPILHYFHSRERSRTLILSLIALDEALTLLQYGVKPSSRPDLAALGSIRRTNTAFLKTLSSAYIEPASENPPPPPLNLLRSKEIPVVSDEEFWDAIKPLTHRRRLLLALAHEDGWTWDSVASTLTTNRATSLDDQTLVNHVILH
ncbi:two pore domain potassium channel family protein [Oculatella sp. LEGE 06141]|uniref:two pore domain potassium channel family protein n=1 Tax=Oculatella sp. LEGE 06141 TaxID=1828648 RepID=UPI0018821895|nr:two pore domain potassium channel family protein [Oculatella sp. LEGE 06141]MBE9182487.1 two pore domain potassium channel family protein [Oculatella sp. LEGE 06141]